VFSNGSLVAPSSGVLCDFHNDNNHNHNDDNDNDDDNNNNNIIYNDKVLLILLDFVKVFALFTLQLGATWRRQRFISAAGQGMPVS
jgi:hypothetical protein